MLKIKALLSNELFALTVILVTAVAGWGFWTFSVQAVEASDEAEGASE